MVIVIIRTGTDVDRSNPQAFAKCGASLGLIAQESGRLQSLVRAMEAPQTLFYRRHRQRIFDSVTHASVARCMAGPHPSLVTMT